MFDLILFMLIITLTTIFIFVIAPILNRTFQNSDIQKIKIVTSTVVSYTQYTFPNEDCETKKHLAISNAKKIFQYLDMEVEEEILQIFIDSEVYLLKSLK